AADVPAHLAALAQMAPGSGAALKRLAALVLVAGLAVAGIFAAPRPAPEPPPAAKPVAPRDAAVPARGREAPRPAVDRHGDPLPAGAVARFGTFRLYQSGGIFALAYSPDGKLLVTTGGDAKVVLWDAVTGKKVRDLVAARHPYGTVQFTHDGREVV